MLRHLCPASIPVQPNLAASTQCAGAAAATTTTAQYTTAEAVKEQDKVHQAMASTVSIISTRDSTNMRHSCRSLRDCLMTSDTFLRRPRSRMCVVSVSSCKPDSRPACKAQRQHGQQQHGKPLPITLCSHGLCLSLSRYWHLAQVPVPAVPRVLLQRKRYQYACSSCLSCQPGTGVLGGLHHAQLPHKQGLSEEMHTQSAVKEA